MVARVNCRECIRHVVAVALFGVVLMTASLATAQNTSEPIRDAETAITNSQNMTDPVRRCQPAEDGTITVCGSDTDANRLSPELRAIAGVGQSTRDSIPPAPPASAATLSKLPFNWKSMGGHYGRPPEHNPLYELQKRLTDPDRASDIEPGP